MLFGANVTVVKLMINVKIKVLRDDVQIPSYATEGSAAVDLRYSGDEPIKISPNERKLIPTGIAIAPETSDVVAILCARSGLASKRGLTLSNGIGVIDSDYRGEICAAMINHGDTEIILEPGERIAQLMFVPVLTANFIKSNELGETIRGAGGFGSTGTK